MQFTTEYLDGLECYSRMRGLVKRILGRAHVDLRTVAERNGYDPDEAEAFFARHVGPPNNLTEHDLVKLHEKFTSDTPPPPVAAPKPTTPQKPKTPEPATPMKKEPKRRPATAGPRPDTTKPTAEAAATPKPDRRSMNTPKRLAQAARVRERHRELLGKWEASGLSMVKFCRQEKLSTGLAVALKKSFPDEYARVRAQRATSEPVAEAGGGAFDDTVKALRALGLKKRDAAERARAAVAAAGPGATAEQLVKLAVARPAAEPAPRTATAPRKARAVAVPPALPALPVPAVHDQVVNVRLNLLVNVAVQLAPT